jgi:hypothetical protein
MNIIWAIAGIIGIIISAVWVSKERKKVPKGTVNPAPFTSGEKLYVALLTIATPIVAGAIFYYGLIKRSPKKAKTANIYSLVVFAIGLAISVLVG